MSIADQITRLKNAKESIKTSVANKGTVIPENTTLDQYSEYIDQIQTAGNYQAKTVTPTANGVTVNPDAGYDALSSVTVNGDSNLTADNVKKGVTIFDVTGTLESGGKYQEKDATPSANGQAILPDEGYDALSRVNIYGDEDLVPNNIKEGVSIFGVAGTYSGGGYDLDLLGYDLDIEAGSSITKGQRIVATKNTSATGKTVATSSSGGSIINLSRDETVGILGSNVTLNADDIPITVCGINDLGIYEPIATGVTSGIAEEKSRYGSSPSMINGSLSDMCIDDDGSKAVFAMTSTLNKSTAGATFYIMNINKTSGSISFKKYRTSDLDIVFDYADTTHNGAKVGYISNFDVCDGHIFAFGQGYSLKLDGTADTSKTGSIFLVLGINNNNLVVKYKTFSTNTINYPYEITKNRVRKREDGKYICATNGGSRIFLMNDNSILQEKTVSPSVRFFSKNGKYIGGVASSTCSIGVINDDLTLTIISKNSTNYGPTYPSDDGTYFILPNGLYSATDPNTKIGTVPAPTCGALSTPNRVVSDSNIYALVPSTEAEYTAIQPRFFYNGKWKDIWNSK